MSAEPPRWVVVGAGSAGCVVARRLVDAGHRVTLLEAGPPLDRDSVPDAISGDDCFAALTEERIHGDLFATRVAGQEPGLYIRGRGVGGSSAVNAMVALDGDRELYRSWGWDDVDDARSRVLVPADAPGPDELGVIDRAMLEAAPDAVLADLTRAAGRRVTSAEAYLWPVADDAALDVVPNASVDRVVTDANATAVGVRLADGTDIGGDRVVLCAGAIHSPAVLLRSRLGLDGVGDGLQDHPAAALALELREPTVRRRHDGRLGLAVATVLDRDPIQMLGMNHVGDPDGPALLLVSLMRPRSASGTVRLRSEDPFEQPRVDFDLLRDRADLALLRSGVREALALLDTPAFRTVVAETYIDDIGTTTTALESDADIERWLLNRSADYVHASGTCAMGRVVEADGAVPQVRNLYVCDASVFPTIPNVNTHVPTMMLAERLTARWVVEHEARDA